jgi:fucose 4-O-acetylase-like acetyltransferase
MIQRTRSTILHPVVVNTAAVAKRVGYVDIAKGIGIILVVMGHNDFALISPFVHKLIYSFHMPMFFFMSGMFFKPALTFWNFIRQRFHRLLKPFGVMLLLIYFASLSFSKVSLVMASRRLLKAMYASGQYLDWVQLWFLPHLFVVSLFAYVFVRALRHRWMFKVRWLLVITLYVVGVVSINVFSPFQLDVFGKAFSLYGLPFSLDLVFVTGFFFMLAYELNQQKYASLLESRWILVGSGALLVLFVWYFPYKLDFNIRQFDSLPINTVEALLGILFILSLSRRLEHISVLSSMFSYVGQASLIILIFQVPIQDYWGQKLLAVTNDLAFSYWMSFLVGVIGPVIINALFIRPNTIVREWFGQTAPRETKESAVSVFE